jgi:hypothetical protein
MAAQIIAASIPKNNDELHPMKRMPCHPRLVSIHRQVPYV